MLAETALETISLWLRPWSLLPVLLCTVLLGEALNSLTSLLFINAFHDFLQETFSSSFSLLCLLPICTWSIKELPKVYLHYRTEHLYSILEVLCASCSCPDSCDVFMWWSLKGCWLDWIPSVSLILPFWATRAKLTFSSLSRGEELLICQKQTYIPGLSYTGTRQELSQWHWNEMLKIKCRTKPEFQVLELERGVKADSIIRLTWCQMSVIILLNGQGHSCFQC